MEHFVAGRLSSMKAAYDELLARDPRFAQRDKLAPGYAALGTHHLERDELAQARAAFARALWLAPDAEDAAALRAQLAFVDAELALSRGVVDLHGYQQALELDGSERVLDVGTGSGYQAALLARLAREVWSVEIVPELADAARIRLRRLGVRNVHVMLGDGSMGWSAAAPSKAPRPR